MFSICLPFVFFCLNLIRISRIWLFTEVATISHHSSSSNIWGYMTSIIQFRLYDKFRLRTFSILPLLTFCFLFILDFVYIFPMRLSTEVATTTEVARTPQQWIEETTSAKVSMFLRFCFRNLFILLYFFIIYHSTAVTNILFPLLSNLIIALLFHFITLNLFIFSKIYISVHNDATRFFYFFFSGEFFKILVYHFKSDADFYVNRAFYRIFITGRN